MWPIIEKLESLSGKTYDAHTNAMRVIADHLRAATFLAVDGCVPSNKQQGYVMRRLVRRAIRFAAFVNEEPPFFQTPAMGSLVHARASRARGDRIVAMLSLETIGYYSDAYKLEFVLPKFQMFRRILAETLAESCVRGRGWSIERAVELGRLILLENPRRLFERPGAESRRGI